MAGSLIFRVMYGYEVSETHDPFITGAEELMARSSSIITSPWLVDFLPVCKCGRNFAFLSRLLIGFRYQ